MKIQVFGRKKYEEPLAFVTALEMEAVEQTAVLEQLDDKEWLELVAIPTDALIQVIGEQLHND